MADVDRKVIVLKTGTTLDELSVEQGDFEDWIIREMGLPGSLMRIIDPRKDPFPEPNTIAGVVITGSHDMVTEHQDWSEQSAKWLRKLVEQDIPVLGICYGHQLLAYALGGKVGDNPLGREFGTRSMHMQPGTETDMLLGDCYPVFKGHVCHTQTVLQPPAGAIILATSDMDACAAFRYSNCAWGVQFHPEFNRKALTTYIRTYAEVLSLQGDDAEQIAASTEEITTGTEILTRFGELCLQRWS